jgi:hypothetical protein
MPLPLNQFHQTKDLLVDETTKQIDKSYWNNGWQINTINNNIIIIIIIIIIKK